MHKARKETCYFSAMCYTISFLLLDTAQANQQVEELILVGFEVCGCAGHTALRPVMRQETAVGTLRNEAVCLPVSGKQEREGRDMRPSVSSGRDHSEPT